jgi:hypothetical protein
MFSKIAASILLMAFVLQTFASPFIMIDYFVNTAAYAKNCVNKTKPKTHCNGKCQMMKKIQEQENKDQQHSQRKAQNKLPVLSSKSFFCSVKIFSTVKENKYSIYNIKFTYKRASSVFHPPQALASAF